MVTKSVEAGPLEMQVLGILEGKEPMGVTSVQAALKELGQDLAYTTVMTVLTRLYNKGLLKREKESRQFLYCSARGRESVSQKLFEKVRKTLFQNERVKPIMALLDGNSDLTSEELKELRRAIDKKLDEKTKKPRI